ncbi:hypothetical protein DLH72_02210 [Candidatus Gracilibacteria bacterium]|nr:MAG: hypothetical protein DLH72_02210 [Candidatus Gracilibacteria bacterium]
MIFYTRLVFKFNLINMREIKNVFVNGISLVSKNEAPAVEQAENRFALFKTVKKELKIDVKKIDEILEKLNKK